MPKVIEASILGVVQKGKFFNRNCMIFFGKSCSFDQY